MKGFFLLLFFSLFFTQVIKALSLADPKGPRPRMLQVKDIEDDMKEVSSNFDMFKYKVDLLAKQAEDARQNMHKSLDQMMLKAKKIK